ncbi:MAG: lactate utilization protein [Kiritimatiellia bacterium]
MNDCSLLEDVCRALRERGFEVQVCADSGVVREAILSKVREMHARTVGFGGSQTVGGLALSDDLAALGCTLYQHNQAGLTPEQKLEICRKQLTCDLFLLSANALTRDGRLVNIDGNGNRIGASLFGPRHVVWVVGRNKLVDGGLSEAIARVREKACPANARRLGCKTPCAQTGGCTDCHSPDRICSIVTCLERRPRLTPSTVLLVAENLGY